MQHSKLFILASALTGYAIATETTPANKAVPEGCKNVCENFGQGHNFCYWDCDGKSNAIVKRDTEHTSALNAAVPEGCKRACENDGKGHNFCWWECDRKANSIEARGGGSPTGSYLACTNGHRDCLCISDKKRDLEKRVVCQPPSRRQWEWVNGKKVWFCGPAAKPKEKRAGCPAGQVRICEHRTGNFKWCYCVPK